MEEISNLLDLFKDRSPPRDFAHRFRSAPIKSGLFRFLAILDSEARLGLESCSASQIDAVIFAAKLLVGSSLSISAESGESLVLVILEKSVEFCLSILEKLKFDDADFSLQNSLPFGAELTFCYSFMEGKQLRQHIPSRNILIRERKKKELSNRRRNAILVPDHWSGAIVAEGSTVAIKRCDLLSIAASQIKNDCQTIKLEAEASSRPYGITAYCLEDYKARGTQASPYFTVTYYTEFAETKGLVLVRRDIVLTSKLTDDEARCLVQTAHSFYLNDT
ncbi:uncharacterized protein A4U43_UnF6040 [Asparagus officinalis]|uniref:Uncharacterized protein n=1 Tax=Asparagus officinalis TaxID=4686 RepID=A0A1R3L6J7_ASPOF|nr:uncharacterized protein A4U43_UnF6040 [Asparagus officinalis]